MRVSKLPSPSLPQPVAALRSRWERRGLGGGEARMVWSEEIIKEVQSCY